MIFYLTPTPCPQPLTWLQLQQPMDKLLKRTLTGTTLLPSFFVLPLHYFTCKSVQVHYCFIREWRNEVGQFVGEDSESPEVDLAFALQVVGCFWGEVERTTQFYFNVGVLLNFLGQSKICQLNIPILKDKNIFWF